MKYKEILNEKMNQEHHYFDERSKKYILAVGPNLYEARKIVTGKIGEEPKNEVIFVKMDSSDEKKAFRQLGKDLQLIKRKDFLKKISKNWGIKINNIHTSTRLSKLDLREL